MSDTSPDKIREPMVQLFFQAFDSVSDPVFVHSQRKDGSPGRFVRVNDAACQRLGYAEEELLARTPQDIGIVLPGRDWGGLSHGRPAAGDGPAESMLQSKDGRIFQAENHFYRFEHNGKQLVLTVSRLIDEVKPDKDGSRGREEKYRQMVENSRDIFYVMDTGGCFTYVSPSVKKSIGFSPQEVVGRSFAEFIHPDHLPFLVRQFERVLKGEESASDYRIVDKAGEIHWVYSTTSPILENGAVVGLQGVLHDITDRKNAEDALRFNQGLQRQVMDIVPVYICAKDIHGKFLLVNKKLADFYGSSVTDMTGRLHAEFCQSEEELQAMLEADRRVMSSGQPVLIPEETMKNPDGTVSALETRKIPFSVDGQPAVLIVADDITDRKKAEEDRARLEAQYRQAQKLESVGRLAGGVAHDLNNLLFPILGYGELLLGGFGGHDGRKSYVEQIVQAGNRARDVVHQLLAFSRKQALAFKPVDLNKVVVRFESLLRRTIREDIDIRFVPEKALPRVLGDVGQLEQVIMNLAVNAQDAMPKGGRLTFETLAAERDVDDPGVQDSAKAGPWVMLKITDTGDGMDAETCENIFEPFFSTKGESGTGLGLATVYGIVKQHGGNIRVHSEVGSGTTFKIFLPVSGKVETPATATVKDAAQPHGHETILIVEDNGPVRKLSREILRHMGYQVLSAEDGNAALTTLDRHPGPVHLILTDVVMPDMDGKALFERIAARRPGVKVLYMSGYTDDVIANKGVLDEGVHFIQKPFSAEVLASKVRETLDE